jgi:tryptophan-rich sensory protein
MSRILALVGFLLASFAVAGLGGATTVNSVREWHPPTPRLRRTSPTIAKPVWTAPSWLFGPVWTVLYALMSVAAWLVFRLRSSFRLRALRFDGHVGVTGGRHVSWSGALVCYAVQLSLVQPSPFPE